MKKIGRKLHEKIEQTVNYETGEITEHKLVTSSSFEKEPDYIKLYLDDIMRLSSIPKSGNNLLMALLKRMTYENEIVIVKSIREEMCSFLGIADITFRKSMDVFCEKGILTKKNKNVYLANPDLFGRGTWQDIKSIRLLIEYNSKGRFIIRDKTNPNQLSLTQDENWSNFIG